MIFRNYEYFIAIAESASVTKAAEKMYVSQPSLSQYLKRLEVALGVELFDRSASPLRLTYAGERYYQYVLSLRELNEKARREFQDIESQVSGRLRLGVALWRGASLLPAILPAFHEQYPNIRIELTEGRSVRLEAALAGDKIDIAVMNLPRTLDYSKCASEIIMEEKILLAAPTEHPYVRELLRSCDYAGKFPVAPKEIFRHVPLVLTKPGQNLTFEVMSALNKSRVEPDILIETENLTTAINLAAEGIACAFVPEGGSQVCQRPGRLTYFVSDLPGLVWDLGAVWRRGAYLTNLSRLFIDFTKQKLRGGQSGIGSSDA